MSTPAASTLSRKSARNFRCFVGVPLGIGFAIGALFWSARALADQQDDVNRVLSHVGKTSAYHLGPRLLEQAEELPLLLPPRVTDARSPGCAHVIVIGAQSVHFSCGPSTSASDTWGDVTASRAGMLEVVRCGDERRDLADATVTMLSLRGPIDAIAFLSSSSAPISNAVLPNRAIGVEVAERTLNRATELPRLGPWLRQLETSAALRGATRTERRALPVQDKIAGESLIGFDPGCHEVHLLADLDWESVDDAGAGVDLTWLDTGELAVQDTLNSRTPSLRVCTSQPRTGQLRFPILPQSAAALVVRSHFAWPGGIPAHWADTVRNRIAQVLVEKRVKSLAPTPVKAWMGGATSLTLELSLNRRSCYIAIVAAATSATGDISLEVRSGPQWGTDSSLDDLAAGVSFCQGEHDTATVAIDARDTSATWILGIWNVAALPPQPDYR
jgi:hypothetical protein